MILQASRALLWAQQATAGVGQHPSSSENVLKASTLSSVPEIDLLTSLIGEANLALLDERQRAVGSKLVGAGQAHLFRDWPEAGVEDDGKKKLMAALVKCDQVYVGGLSTYIAKARALLESSARGDNAFEGLFASVPEGETLRWGEADYQSAEEAGLDSIASNGIGFVLVAGGLGERLGYDGIKLELPVESLTGTSFLELYCDFIAALQRRVGRALPLAIMTSDDTDSRTRELLKERSNFGLEYISIMKQDKVPALSDSKASLVVEDKWSLSTKPHGHGDVHALMRSSGIARDWLEKLGIGHIFFFQDTNPLAINTVLPALGVTVRRGFSMNSVCIPRRATEPAGAIARLSSFDEKQADLVINVEYNQLDPVLRASTGSGDVNDPSTGFSPYPGNANVLIINLVDYVTTIGGRDQGVVDEFVNPKYKDETKTTFKKPTRLECMMQDYPKLLKRELPNAKVGFTSFERWLAFSPAKNNLGAARALASAGEPAGSAGSCEFDLYASHVRKLGWEIEPLVAFGGVRSLFAGPKVVFKPSFAITAKDIASKVGHLSMDNDAALVVDGDNIRIKSLELRNKAALQIVNKRPDALLVVDGLVLDESQGGFTISDVPDDKIDQARPFEKIRGFATSTDFALIVHLDKPGTFVLGRDMELRPHDANPEL